MHLNVNRILKNILSAFIVCLAALILVALMIKNGAYPHGNDVYGHFFKLNALYEQIKQGNPYPIYIENWYSGLELFRYWPPAPYYFFVFIMRFFGGDLLRSFLVFSFLAHAIGGCGFLLFGDREERRVLCTFLGVMYIFLPDNLRVFFAEGNIPRIFITMLLPYLFYFVCEYIYYKSEKAIIGIDILCILIACSHLMVALMTAIAVAVFVLIYGAINKRLLNSFVLLLNMLLAYMTAGIILIPGMLGSINAKGTSAYRDISEAMLSRRAIESLNPFLVPLDPTGFYFGLPVFLLLLAGVIVWHKKTLPLFGTGLIIFIGTTTIVLPILSALPVSRALWMTRFVPMAYCLILIGILYWDELKKSALVVFSIMIALDCALTLAFHVMPDNPAYPSPEEMEEDYLLDEAMDLVDNRIAFMDLSSIGSYTSYILTKDGRNVDSIFGWAYQGAYTINEIVELNEAFETGYYDYVFDRLVRMGCDTLVFKKDEIKTDYDGLLEKAAESGYKVIDENEKALLMDFSYDGKFGTIFNYKNACIGVGSEYMSYLYPSFYKLRSNKLDDYTYEDLSGFEKIYITGPEYGDKEYCEEMIRKLSDSGVKVFIDMNRLPLDKSTGRNSLLGVVAQPIVFNDEFPYIVMDDGTKFKLSVKDKRAFKEWRTVYFTNLKNITKKAKYSDSKYLAYLGTSPNDNITFIGLNLVYFQGCSVNGDTQLYRFLDEVFKVDRHETPEHILVPINVAVNGNDITITSEQDGVVTGLANLDSLESTKDLGSETYITVNKGVTYVHTKYAYFYPGLACSLVGLLLLILSIRFITGKYSVFGYGRAIRMAKFDDEAPPEGNSSDTDDTSDKHTSFIDESYHKMLEGEKDET